MKISGALDVFGLGAIGVPVKVWFSPKVNALCRALLLSLSTGWRCLSLIRYAELLSHSNQIRERVRPHLLHDVSAMKFDRPVGGDEFSGDLFVEQTQYQKREHLPLAGSK
jgi:hypothetical protein